MPAALHSRGLPAASPLPTPRRAYLRARGRDDHVPGRLDPGLAVHLHRCGLEEGDTEVGPLGNADAGAQPTLDLTLVGERGSQAQRAAAPQPSPPVPRPRAHHVHDARHPHHLQQPVIHARLLESRVTVGAPQVGPRAPAAPRGRGTQVRGRPGGRLEGSRGPGSPACGHLGMLMKMSPSMLGSSTSCCSACSRSALCRPRGWLSFCSPARTYTPLLWNLAGDRQSRGAPAPGHCW